MLDLYLSELRRFRNAAIIYGVASLLILTLLSQIMDMANAPREVHQVLYLLYSLSGLGFAAYQFSTYRQPSRWIWLQHRPLHRSRILAAIALAAITLIALAAALPLYVVLASQDHFTQRVIDARHYAGAGFLALSVLAAWLAGAYMVLHRSRWAFVILILPLLLMLHQATWTTMLALAVGCNVLLLLLVYTVFRPNRYTLGDTPATVASAVPLQVSFYLALLWAGSSVFQVGQMLAGVHPLNSDHPPRGGYTETVRMEDHDAVLAGLATSTDPRATAWRRAITRDATASIGPDIRQYAVRGLLTTEGTLSYRDHNQNLWTFSHDQMRYNGINMRTRANQGWLGTGGLGDTGRFGAQPIPERDNRGHGYLVTPHDIYAEGPQQSMRHVLHIEGSEQLAGTLGFVGPRTALLTNQRVLVLPASGQVADAVASIPLPRPFGELARTDVAPVPDGTLVSLTFGRRRLDGIVASPQLVYFVGQQGQVQLVAQRELLHDFPVLFEHKDWWLSPVLDAVVALPSILIDKGMVPDVGVSPFEPLLRPRPMAAWIAAAVLSLLAASGALWWSRAARLPACARAGWTVACLLLGVPALLSLMVLQPREQREPGPARARGPATSGGPTAATA